MSQPCGLLNAPSAAGAAPRLLFLSALVFLAASCAQEGYYNPSAIVSPAAASAAGREEYERGLSLGGRNNEEAAQWYVKSADKGNPNAQSALGLFYQNGWGVARDYSEAIKYYRMAAAQGDAIAPLHLGEMFQRGVGVPIDLDEAERWYRMAAERGNSAGNDRLVSMSKISHKTIQRSGGEAPAAAGQLEDALAALKSKDYAAAHDILLLLAKGGDKDAQFYLGSTYKNGFGVAIDYVEAAKWVRMSADQGFEPAQEMLGNMYEKGLGVPQDHAEAIRLIDKSYENATAWNQYNLATKYETGAGLTTRDNAKAIQWYRKAADRGSPEAKSRLKALLASDGGAGTGADISQAGRPLGALEAPGLPIQSAPPPSPALPQRFASVPLAFTFPKAPQRADDIAVIIGNADYSKQGHDIPDARTAYADAESMRRYALGGLGVREGNVIFLKDATGTQLAEVFGNERDHRGKLFNWVKPGKSRVFVYYIGHGAPGNAEGRAMLVPSDASAGQIALSGYPLDLLYANLGKVPAENVTVVLDACFSGASPAGSVVGKALPIGIMPKSAHVPTNVTVISAAAADQMANWEQDDSHALFTEYFLKGMSGEADKPPYGNGDGKVTLDELDRYLKETLSYVARRYYGRDQTAQIIRGEK